MTIATTPPAPADAWEILRWDHTRLRRRMLTGEWRQDLVRAVNLTLGVEQAAEIATVDMSSNVFLSACTNLAVNYDVSPVATHADPQAAGLMNALLDDAAYAPTMQKVQRLTLGLREMLVEVHCEPTPDGDLPASIALEPVYPDLVVGRPNPRRSYELLAVEEAEYANINGVCRWVWEKVSADPANPYHETYDAQTGELVDQEEVVFDSKGVPVLPYVLYHAEVGPSLWDHTHWRELVEGTINIAVKRTAASHNLINASYVQRYTIGLKMASEEVDGRHVVAGGASKVMALDYDGEHNTGTAGAWPQGFDPATFQAALKEAESQLASNSGIPVTDLQRGSGDPQSGFSLMLSREGKKEQSRRLEPAFRRSDVLLFRTIACMVNQAVGTPILPEDGWGISYKALPMSEEELTVRQDRYVKQMEAGLISKAEARSKMTGETLAEAQASIKRIAADNAGLI